MDNIQKKLLLKKKKRILSILNLVSSLDQTEIVFDGNKDDKYSKILNTSLMSSLSSKTLLNDTFLKMKGLTGRKYRMMINSLINLLDKPSYIEIGSWLGSSACSASYNNNLKITCIDNWSQNFIPELNPKTEFTKNINKALSKESKIDIINEDFREVNYEKLDQHDVFFMDGPHHYQDHFDAICLIQPALKNRHIMIIDDWNWKQVREATFHSIKKNELEIISSIEIRTTQDDSSSLIIGENSDWHQGCIFLNIKK